MTERLAKLKRYRVGYRTTETLWYEIDAVDANEAGTNAIFDGELVCSGADYDAQAIACEEVAP